MRKRKWRWSLKFPPSSKIHLLKYLLVWKVTNFNNTLFFSPSPSWVTSGGSYRRKGLQWQRSVIQNHSSWRGPLPGPTGYRQGPRDRLTMGRVHIPAAGQRQGEAQSPRASWPSSVPFPPCGLTFLPSAGGPTVTSWVVSWEERCPWEISDVLK